MTEVSIANDSVQIFDSEAGQLALTFAWELYGKKTFQIAITVHVIYVALVSVANYNFQIWMNPNMVFSIDDQRYVSDSESDEPYRPKAATALVILVIIFSSYLAYKTARQFHINGMKFFASVWNLSAILYQVCNIAGSALRLINGHDTPESRVLLSIAVMAPPHTFFLI